MKVLQLSPYPPPEGGVSRNALAIRDELLKNGHRCLMIATAKSWRVAPEPDVYHPRSAFELIKFLAKLDFDVLHFHLGGMLPARIVALLAICAIFGRGKSVLTFHSGVYTAQRALTAKFFTPAAFVFRRYRKIICVNSLMLQMFENFGVKKERLHLIAPFALRNPDPAVELPSKLKKFAENHQPFLLTVGLLTENYDLFMQIEMMEKTLEKLPNAGLMIVGSGVLEASLRAEIAEKSYAESLFLTGDVAYQETLHLIERADVLLRTTLSDGDAISVREALFLETPVVATDNGMRPDGVHLIPMRDAGALAETIENLSKRPKKKKIKKKDDNRNIIEVLKIYEGLTEVDFVGERRGENS